MVVLWEMSPSWRKCVTGDMPVKDLFGPACFLSLLLASWSPRGEQLSSAMPYFQDGSAYHTPKSNGASRALLNNENKRNNSPLNCFFQVFVIEMRGLINIVSPLTEYFQ